MLVTALGRVWYWFCRWVCRIACILLFHFRIHGAENVPAKGPFLLISNHQSYLDPVFCGVFLRRPLHFLARDSLFANPFFRMLICSLNAIPVKRGKADVSAMKTVIGKLKEGNAVCLFPEATRTSDGRIAELKGGFGLLSRRAHATIVPTVIEGAFECWPRDKKVFSLREHIVVSYGKPITAERISAMDDKKLAELLTETLRLMQTKIRLTNGKKPHNY